MMGIVSLNELKIGFGFDGYFLINDRFKLNFGGSMIHNSSALRWIIRGSNGIIKWPHVDI